MTWKEFYDLYKSCSDKIWDIVATMTKSEAEEIIAEAQKHDLTGTYEMCMWLGTQLDYMD